MPASPFCQTTLEDEQLRAINENEKLRNGDENLGLEMEYKELSWCFVI